MPPDAAPPSKPSLLERLETFYHPASGGLILGADLLAFGGEAMTGFLDTALVSAATFAVVFFGVMKIQRKWGHDLPRAAFWKAFLGALLAAIPLPITGTFLGTAILFLSGLHHMKLKAGLYGLKKARGLLFKRP